MRTIRSESPHVPPVISTSPVASDVISMHFANVRRVLAEVQVYAVQRLVEIFREARDRGSFIYIAGNGGSSSTASHWVNDLGKATKRSGCRPLKVMCLSDNMSWFSALSNDEGYERAFSGQLENFASPGDVLTCISASGNSPNLVRAVAPYRLNELDIHDVLNVFQVTGLTADDRYFVKASPAKRGDFIEFFAEIDVLCAISTCPHGDLSVQMWGADAGDPLATCRPLGVEIWQPDAALLAGWRPPAPADYRGDHGLGRG